MLDQPIDLLFAIDLAVDGHEGVLDVLMELAAPRSRARDAERSEQR